MRTITTKADIGPAGLLVVQLPPDVEPGRYEVVVILERVPTQEPVRGGPYPFGPTDPNCTFSHEDLYGDDGR